MDSQSESYDVRDVQQRPADTEAPPIGQFFCNRAVHYVNPLCYLAGMREPLKAIYKTESWGGYSRALR